MSLTVVPVSPAAHGATPTTPVTFTVEGDGSINDLVVVAIYSGTLTRELVYDSAHGWNGGYMGPLNRVSTTTDSGTGQPISTFQVLRDGGWPADLTIEVSQGVAGVGSVTEVDTGAGLTGGPITGVGTISMPNVGPGAGTVGSSGTYLKSATLDAQGRVTAIATGTYGVGGAVPSGTPKSILFIDAAGALGQDVTNLAWDYTAHVLTVGGNILIPAGGDLDTATAGTLNLGAFNANAIQIGGGSTGATAINGAALYIGSASTSTTTQVYGRTYTQFFADGGLYVDQVPDASSGTTTKNSPNLILRGKYWNGSTSSALDNYISTVVTSTAPTSYIQFAVQGKALAWDSAGTLVSGDNVSSLGVAAGRWAKSYVVDSYMDTVRATNGGSEVHVVAAAGTPGTGILALASNDTYSSIIWPLTDLSKSCGWVINRWGSVYTAQVSSGDSTPAANDTAGQGITVVAQKGGASSAGSGGATGGGTGGFVSIVAESGGPGWSGTMPNTPNGDGGQVYIASGGGGSSSSESGGGSSGHIVLNIGAPSGGGYGSFFWQFNGSDALYLTHGSNLYPPTTSSNLGTSGNHWGAAFIDTINAVEVLPSTSPSNIGTSVNLWDAGYFSIANANTFDTPVSGTLTIGGNATGVLFDASVGAVAFNANVTVYPGTTNTGGFGNNSNTWATAWFTSLHIKDGFARYEGSSTSVPSSPWTAPTLLNSWVNYGTNGQVVGYFKDTHGIVHVKGTVKNGTAGNAFVFTLPVGYRPADTVNLPAVSSLGYASIQVYGNGNIAFVSGGSTTWSALDSISFLAEQ